MQSNLDMSYHRFVLLKLMAEFLNSKTRIMVNSYTKRLKKFIF